MKRTVVCEYVGLGHPDKVADQISDALLDAFLKEDPNTRAGIEVMIKDNVVVLGGEVKSDAQIDYEKIVKDTVGELDYPANHHLSKDDISVINLMGKQSPEISRSVDQDDGIIGAGDQGFCVGFASNETRAYMPLGAYLAKKICQCEEFRRHGIGPDIKSQVIVTYEGKGKSHVDSILVSAMHQCSLDECRTIVQENVMKICEEVDKRLTCQHVIDDHPDIVVNPAGEWRIGGSVSDCGMTNRKIVVDQYGGYAPVGGGGLSGKDMTKVDRSATYMCRYLAKNLVATGLIDTAKVELAYMIGVPQPCAINIEMDRHQEQAERIVAWIREHIDLSPKGIMDRFDASVPRYKLVTRWGHFGITDRERWRMANPNCFSWEKTDLVNDLRMVLVRGTNLDRFFNEVENITAVCTCDISNMGVEYPELEIGKTYQVSHIGVQKSYTLVRIEGLDRRFYSDCFDLYENGKPLKEYYDDPRFLAPYLRNRNKRQKCDS